VKVKNILSLFYFIFSFLFLIKVKSKKKKVKNDIGKNIGNLLWSVFFFFFFFLEKKMILFPTCRENGWEAAENAL